MQLYERGTFLNKVFVVIKTDVFARQRLQKVDFRFQKLNVVCVVADFFLTVGTVAHKSVIAADKTKAAFCMAGRYFTYFNPGIPFKYLSAFYDVAPERTAFGVFGQIKVVVFYTEQVYDVVRMKVRKDNVLWSADVVYKVAGGGSNAYVINPGSIFCFDEDNIT